MSVGSTEIAIADMTGLSTTPASERTLIGQAITAAGQAACTWQGRSWWWLREKKTFPTTYQALTHVERATNVATLTVASHDLVVGCRIDVSDVTTSGFDAVDAAVTAVTSTTIAYANTGDDVAKTADATGAVSGMGYPLRTINSSAMTDLYAPVRVWIDDDYQLVPWSREQYENWVVMDWGTGQPIAYAISGDQSILLSPVPDDDYTITVEYVKRHSVITSGSANTDLIVPAEYQWATYVLGSAWMIRHDTTDVGSLADCPAFARAMKSMAQADPSMHYDSRDGFGIPANRKAGPGWIGGTASTS
jgi:hypothetical protein